MDSGCDVNQVARDTGRFLVADLEAARRQSDDWQDVAAATPLVYAAFDSALARLRATGVWGEANRLPSSCLWSVAGPALSAGEMLLHARTKPHGYAGDYQMLARIIGEYRSPSLPGRIYDDYFQTRMAPQAVRNRTRLIADKALAAFARRPGKTFRLTSVGSGPALDVAAMLAALPRQDRQRVHVRLLDLDPHALAYADDHLQVAGAGSVSAHRENLFRLADRPRGRALLEGSDFSACTGFVDYLSDEDAARLLGAVWCGLAEGGELAAMNFSPVNECRDYMEWIGNWYLIYRDEAQFRAVVQAAGIPGEQCRFGAEATGSDLYVWARKSA